MATEITTVINKLKAVRASIPQIVLDLVRENEQFVINLQQGQLGEGFDSKGQQIKPSYAQSTIARKKKKGQPFNRVTLKDKGDYYKSFDIIYNESGGTFVLKATNFVRQYLVKRYGEDIEGLTPESIELVSKEIQDRLLEVIQEKIDS
jgi:hypothetical protein